MGFCWTYNVGEGFSAEAFCIRFTHSIPTGANWYARKRNGLLVVSPLSSTQIWKSSSTEIDLSDSENMCISNIRTKTSKEITYPGTTESEGY